MSSRESQPALPSYDNSEVALSVDQPAGPAAQPAAKPNHSHLRALGFAIGFLLLALGLTLAAFMLTLPDFQDEPYQSPPSLADRATASAIFLLIASPGLLICIFLRRRT